MRHTPAISIAAQALLLGLVVLSADAAGPPRATTQSRVLTLADFSRLREVADPRVSPDGAWVAYAVTTQNLEADKKQGDLWMSSWDGATTLRLTTTPSESESSPRSGLRGRAPRAPGHRGRPAAPDQVQEAGAQLGSACWESRAPVGPAGLCPHRGLP